MLANRHISDTRLLVPMLKAKTMKKSHFALVAFVFIVSFAKGQTNVYHPFPNPVIWRADYYYDLEFQYPCRKWYYFQYYSSGDTLINSKVYRKIFLIGIYDHQTCLGEPIYLPNPGYMGALRDDSSANKTFFRFPNSSADSLLYDYNLTVGDTLKGFITYPAINYHPVVLSVDSISINGQFHKKWNFTQEPDPLGNFPYIIEGIGTSAGFIDYIFTNNVDMSYRYLRCVRDSSIIYFNSGTGCDLILSTPDELPLESNCKVFPNPTFNEATLKVDQDLENATISIINIFGEQIRQIKNFTGKEIILYRENLSNGIYFLRIIQENKIIASKKLLFD